MPRPFRFVALLSLALGLQAFAPSVAEAQFSYARSAAEKVRSTAGNLSADRERRDSLPQARQIYEDLGTVMDRLGDCGRELAEFGSRFGEERGRIRRAAQAARGQAEATRKAVDSWIRKLDSTENHKSEYENARSQLSNFEREWSELQKRVEETRRWLSDGVASTQSQKDRLMGDCRPISNAQNAAWARFLEAQRNENRRDEEHDRLVERFAGAEAKENDACSRYIDAYTARRGTEEVWALKLQWHRSIDEARELAASCYGAFQALRQARDECERAYRELAQAQNELRNWAAGTNLNEIVELNNFYVRWNELFTKEFA
jgi:DNA repair exonuclease SbcCD ATPase subunit